MDGHTFLNTYFENVMHGRVENGCTHEDCGMCLVSCDYAELLLFGANAQQKSRGAAGFPGNLDDSWEKVREAAQAALDLLPSPLPGYESRPLAEGLIVRGLKLLSNPRAAQADAGRTSRRATRFKSHPVGVKNSSGAVFFSIQLLWRSKKTDGCPAREDVCVRCAIVFAEQSN